MYLAYSMDLKLGRKPGETHNSTILLAIPQEISDHRKPYNTTPKGTPTLLRHVTHFLCNTTSTQSTTFHTLTAPASAHHSTWLIGRLNGGEWQRSKVKSIGGTLPPPLWWHQPGQQARHCSRKSCQTAKVGHQSLHQLIN